LHLARLELKELEQNYRSKARKVRAGKQLHHWTPMVWGLKWASLVTMLVLG